VSGCLTSHLLQKLKLLKASLRTWNWEAFRNFSTRVTMAMDRVTKIQNRLHVDSFSEQIFQEEADDLTALGNDFFLAV
ncbi:hypothetical protein PanWU01x14_344410, partial [Parasponia andersonii]